jgi:hypothetical protein
MSGTPSTPSLGDVVSAAGLGVAVLTGWLYAAGWTYVYNYFALFNVPLLMVDFPFEHYLVYGGSVPIYFPLLSTTLLVLVAIALAIIYRRAAYLGRAGAAAALVTLVALAFVLARWGGASTALIEFQTQRPGICLLPTNPVTSRRQFRTVGRAC